MLDFTSALYLGLDHPSRGLPGWEQLTLGKPARLKNPPGAKEVERRLASLIGCESALLATSTLHLFWDLFTLFASGVNIFLDEGAYPIVRWGVEHAACRGAQVRTFRQHDLDSLREAIDESAGRPPVIVTDGYCPGCGAFAPLAAYVAEVAPRGGYVVVDDSQALGIFGDPAANVPYGIGGGGSMKRAGVSSDRLLIGSSLAKAFGAPVAVLAGSAALIERFERESATRVHCSPPSVAVIAAAYRALSINRRHGDRIRLSLAQLVARFRRGLRRLRLIALPGLFPVQPIRLPAERSAQEFHEELRRRGVEAVLHRGQRTEARISFVLTAHHTSDEVDQAVGALAKPIGSRTRFELERS